MPIRFRCAYCNQLMGIARRKAGTIVRCPTCAGQVVVPNPRGEAFEDEPAPPEPEPELESPPAPPPPMLETKPSKPNKPPPAAPRLNAGLFEQSDFDDMFDKQPPGGPKGRAAVAPAPAPLPALDVEIVPYAGHLTRLTPRVETPGKGAAPGKGRIALLVLVVLLLLTLAFFAGLFVGRAYPA